MLKEATYALVGRLRGGRWLAVLVGICLAAMPAALAETVTQSDLQAAVRALGFLDSLQHRATVQVGVVYAEGGEAAASRVAVMLSGLRGVDSASIKAIAVPVEDLLRGGGHYDAVYLMPGLSANGRRVSDHVKAQHLVSVSSDPACLSGGYCVLMVRTGTGVDIVLDTGLANAAGARFASVFTLMVKRK